MFISIFIAFQFIFNDKQIDCVSFHVLFFLSTVLFCQPKVNPTILRQGKQGESNAKLKLRQPVIETIV